MTDKIEDIVRRYKEIERMLSLPDAISDNRKYSELVKEYKKLEPIALCYQSMVAIDTEIRETESLLSEETGDPELYRFAEEEIEKLRKKRKTLDGEIGLLLLPKDPDDEKNVVVEIRQGTGGEEAALFAADLFRMYSMYLMKKGFSVTVTEANETELGGFKNVTFLVKGKGAFSKMKYESGVHRVQRVPVTESNGRIQTSAVSVAVLPEAEEIDVSVSHSDIVFESCKSSGAGGQHINKTESAVRLTHKPTGIVVECDSERSQLQNKETAMRVLRSKLYEIEIKARDDSIADARRSQIGSGDRSEKIRTYNFPQSRVTDHRINKTIFTLENFLDGDMDPLIEELSKDETTRKLRGEA